jgi:hypothetical protein
MELRLASPASLVSADSIVSALRISFVAASARTGDPLNPMELRSPAAILARLAGLLGRSPTTLLSLGSLLGWAQFRQETV